MGRKLRDGFNPYAYRAVHIDHFGEDPQPKPRGVGIVAWDSGRHHEAQGKGRQAADAAIRLRILFELVGLVVHFPHKIFILVLDVFLSETVTVFVAHKVTLEGIFELIHDLLKEFFVGAVMGALPGVSRDKPEDGPRHVGFILRLDHG
jgi:hypothetical protein